MKNWVSHILNVQKLDMRLRRLETKYRTIPSEKARMASEIDEAASKVKEASANVRKIENSIREAQAESAVLNEKMRKTQTQSTMVKKNTEYQAMMNDIDSTRKKISDIETMEIELYDKLDAAKKSLSEMENIHSETVKTAKAEAAELSILAGEIKEEALKVKAERKGFEGLCDMTVLAAYKHLREKEKDSPVVVPVKGGACAHCFLKITPQTLNEAKKGQLVFCDNCANIIYDADSPSDYQS